MSQYMGKILAHQQATPVLCGRGYCYQLMRFSCVHCLFVIVVNCRSIMAVCLTSILVFIFLPFSSEWLSN